MYVPDDLGAGSRAGKGAYRFSPRVKMDDIKMLTAQGSPESPCANGIMHASGPVNGDRRRADGPQQINKRAGPSQEQGVNPVTGRIEPLTESSHKVRNARTFRLGRSEYVQDMLNHDFLNTWHENWKLLICILEGRAIEMKDAFA